jgi:hypothetical protein
MPRINGWEILPNELEGESIEHMFEATGWQIHSEGNPYPVLFWLHLSSGRITGVALVGRSLRVADPLMNCDGYSRVGS